MRTFIDQAGSRALGILALAALLHFAQPAPISAQNAGGGGQASARAVATVVSVSGVHEAHAMLTSLRVELGREAQTPRKSSETRREEGGVVVEARREAAHGGITVTVAHLGS